MGWLLESVGALLAAVGILAAPDATVYYGYVEGDYLYLSPRAAGVVVELAVEEGMTVASGDLVFRLDSERERASVAAAKARLAEAEATARDRAAGGRSPEVAAAEAQLEEARARFELAQREFERSSKLVGRGVVTAARADSDRAALETARAEVERLSSLLEVARLPAREDQIEAARRSVDAARAALDQAEADLADRTVHSPAGGLVDRVFYDVGERVGAGAAVLSVLPPGAVTIRFFVPEPKRALLAPGDRIVIGCSSCVEPLAGTVTHLSTEAEHTPPVIFSREERARLVFAAEARPDSPFPLLPGQPVDVRRAP